MRRSPLVWVPLQCCSVVVAWFVLLSIFAVYTGLAGASYGLSVLGTLAAAVALRYAAVYHRFTRRSFRIVAVAVLGVAFLAAAVVTVDAVPSTLSLDGLEAAFRTGGFQWGARNFLPRWWIAVILLPAAGLTLVGALLAPDVSPFPRPTALREVARSPAYFGVACTVFGLWAVLFVGISIQRVLVIAPIFEELLKFGVALLIGSALFGRSRTAGIGVALVVGSLFGLVEHATTYPGEADDVYVFRTAFHAMTTVLSVSVYSTFESIGADRLRWIAPVYSMLLHFFYNTFVVLSAILTVAVFGSPQTIVSQVYGGAAILLATGLVVLATVSREKLVAIHRPLEQVLSDLV